MDRLQKKCFIAATGFHLCLVVILFVGPAFLFPDKQRSDLQMIDVIPYKIIEAPFVGGGSPNVKPPPPAAQPTPTPPVPEARPVPPPPTRDEAPPKPEPKQVTRDRDAIEDEKPTKPRLPKVSTKLVPRPKTGQANNPSKNAETNTRENSKEVAALQSALRTLKDGLSSATEVGIVGPGGEAYAGYENVIQSIYQRRYDQELLTAGDVGTQVVEVEVTVTVARGGDVLSARLLKPSSNAAMNRVVQRVLERVTFIAPFPEGAKDAQRTFNIIFELKPKRAIG